MISVNEHWVWLYESCYHKSSFNKSSYLEGKKHQGFNMRLKNRKRPWKIRLFNKAILHFCLVPHLLITKTPIPDFPISIFLNSSQILWYFSQWEVKSIFLLFVYALLDQQNVIGVMQCQFPEPGLWNQQLPYILSFKTFLESSRHIVIRPVKWAHVGVAVYILSWDLCKRPVSTTRSCKYIIFQMIKVLDFELPSAFMYFWLKPPTSGNRDKVSPLCSVHGVYEYNKP